MIKNITKANRLVIKHNVPITLEDVLAVGMKSQNVKLARAAKEMLSQRRQDLTGHIDESGAAIYGINTGFGRNVDLAISHANLSTLQRNLILSHACGVGPSADESIVRMTMLLRARSLARGHSGVRPIVVETILDFLNAGITPVVPRFGSVSASGDLAPLSHIALGLIGEGNVHYKGKIVSAKEALAAEKINPLVLEAKEGLALNNGAQYSNALGIFCWHKVSLLLENACLATAMSAQVMLGADTPFQADLHALRPHAGALNVAQLIYGYMQNSPIRESHRSFDVDGEVQDPYNIRCAAQILGTCREALDRAHKTFQTEANSVTDNPVILPEKSGRYSNVVSGGHFHGMPIAQDLFGLMQSVGIMASLTNARCQRYIDAARNKGLGSYLMWPGATDDPAWIEKQSVSSGMMIPEYTSAALLNGIWGLSTPSHLMSVPTSAGQEDHVSMAANVGLRLVDATDHLAHMIGIEFAYIGQAAAIRKEMEWIPSKVEDKNRHYWCEGERTLNDIGEKALAAIYSVFPPVKEDRYMADELKNLALLVSSGELIDRISPCAGANNNPKPALIHRSRHHPIAQFG